MVSKGPPHQGSSERQQIRIGIRMMGIGFETVSQVVAGLLIGWLFDHLRGHGDIGILVGGATGSLVGIFSLVRNAWKLNASMDAASRRTPRKPPADTQL